MDPNQNQYSIDYLNQIAPPEKKPGMSNKLFLGLVGGGILIAAVVGLFLLFSSGDNDTKRTTTLALRLQTLERTAKNAQKNIKSNELRSTNSNLLIFLANTNRDIAVPLTKNNINLKKVDKKVIARENGQTLANTLEDARLNAIYDRVYAREMTYQLETVAALINQLNKNSKSKTLKTFLQNTNTNLNPIQKQFSEFSSSTS